MILKGAKSHGCHTRPEHCPRHRQGLAATATALGQLVSTALMTEDEDGESLGHLFRSDIAVMAESLITITDRLLAIPDLPGSGELELVRIRRELERS
jgi:hypothetical protein